LGYFRKQFYTKPALTIKLRFNEMKKPIIIAAVAVVAIIVIAGAYLGYSGLVAPPEQLLLQALL
jgi:asparagine N-glycosylation enzyme membrane subunit Stt3